MAQISYLILESGKTPPTIPKTRARLIQMRYEVDPSYLDKDSVLFYFAFKMGTHVACRDIRLSGDAR